MNPSNERYSRPMMAVHWLTLILLIGVYSLIELRGLAPKSNPLHDAMKSWHAMLGLTVFCLVFIRLAIRGMSRVPPITPPVPAWQHRLASVMHIVLYAFLILMPLLGWLTLSAQGKPVPFFGWEWPALIGPDKALGRTLQDIHEVIGNIGYFLIGLHAAAALAHHYVLRDDTLVRMLPGRRPVPARPAGHQDRGFSSH
ncbi:cytochrome b [uncultured Castellaniella sp.]|uniref:cytochrome b n=1 Tax=uncultured Castellaniella sp. TaxID=647907 RepID=UPI002620C444|nr:cytochrome b [uncultured Castellaniella sp.]